MTCPLTWAGAEATARRCGGGCPAAPRAGALLGLGREPGCPTGGCRACEAPGRTPGAAEPGKAAGAASCSTGALMSLSASSVTGLPACIHTITINKLSCRKLDWEPARYRQKVWMESLAA